MYGLYTARASIKVWERDAYKVLFVTLAVLMEGNSDVLIDINTIKHSQKKKTK